MANHVASEKPHTLGGHCRPYADHDSDGIVPEVMTLGLSSGAIRWPR